MGAFDDREKLEVAIEEVGRLEREVARLMSINNRDVASLAHVVVERDRLVLSLEKALAERDASRAVNEEFLRAANCAALAEQSEHLAAHPMNGDDGRDE